MSKGLKKEIKALVSWINSHLSAQNLRESEGTISEESPDSDYDLSLTSIKSESQVKQSFLVSVKSALTR